MEEDDLGFDPTMKKKKKKKKVEFDEETAPAAEAPVATETSAPASSEASAPAVVDPEPASEVTEDLDLDLTKKKKKKKKTTLQLDEQAEGAETHTDDAPAPAEPAEAPAPAPAVEDDDELLLPMKKHKKKAAKKLDLDLDDEDDEETVSTVFSDSKIDASREYQYNELLARVFSIMRAKNPEMASGEKKKFVMKPPQVMRVGTKKSAFVNFTDICKTLHRQPDHLLAFVLAELGTSGSVDSSNALVIKGRYQQKQIESVLRKYIKEYVTCHTCKSPDTMLAKENRLYFLKCETCSSRCSVASIKSGFQALTGKRAAIRAKTDA